MALRRAWEGAIHLLRRAPSILIFIPILLLLSVPVASAQVQARIRVIGASNAGTVIDPSLKDVHTELGSLFSFTSYRLLRDLPLGLVGNRPVEVPVHPGRSLEITLVGEYKNTVELRIRIKREGTAILSTQVRLASGRTILIGGPRYGEGVVILAISARF